MKGQKKKIAVLTLVLTALFAVGISGAIGSEDDPLISLSYIENVLMPYIDQAVSGNEEAGFVVVELNAGQSLTAYSGSEIILRSGEGIVTIPASASGGFTDVTAGKDIVSGDAAEANHLLICPRSDGRQIKARTKVYLMIRGNYEVE